MKKTDHRNVSQKKSFPEEKNNLHPRNPHRFRYDFAALINSYSELAKFVRKNDYGNDSVDFADANAVKTLNKAILKHFYHLSYWDIPAGYLCPPIPGRADYIHYIADLLSVNGQVPKGERVRGLDIGVGANCVYPILGSQSYGWSFVGADADQKAIQNAEKIVTSNIQLGTLIECRFQSSTSQIFNGIIRPDDHFDFTMCNPPFHTSLAAANAGTKRKWNNLKKGKVSGNPSLNFGGQQAELSYPGGEQAFILNMISESAAYGRQCKWFTSLLSKKETLPSAYSRLKTLDVSEVKTISMSQGQKVSRILAWTFV